MRRTPYESATAPTSQNVSFAGRWPTGYYLFRIHMKWNFVSVTTVSELIFTPLTGITWFLSGKLRLRQFLQVGDTSSNTSSKHMYIR